MKTFTCALCSQEFTAFASQPRVYCSKPCQYKAMSLARSDPSTHLTTTCPACGKEFSFDRSWPRKYCSNVCKGQGTIGNIKRFAPSRFTATCESCGAAYETTPAISRGRFCSLTCYGKWKSVHQRGDSHPTKGRKYGRASHLPPPSMPPCAVCGKPFLTKPSQSDRRRCCSRACAAIWQSEHSTGENNHTWRGGPQPYYGPSWHTAKRATRWRDTVCVDCGITAEKNGRALDVHHLTPFRAYGVDRHKEANDLNNLIALCRVCHLNFEWATNRRNPVPVI